MPCQQRRARFSLPLPLTRHNRVRPPCVLRLRHKWPRGFPSKEHETQQRLLGQGGRGRCHLRQHRGGADNGGLAGHLAGTAGALVVLLAVLVGLCLGAERSDGVGREPPRVVGGRVERRARAARRFQVPCVSDAASTYHAGAVARGRGAVAAALARSVADLLRVDGAGDAVLHLQVEAGQHVFWSSGPGRGTQRVNGRNAGAARPPAGCRHGMARRAGADGEKGVKKRGGWPRCRLPPLTVVHRGLLQVTHGGLLDNVLHEKPLDGLVLNSGDATGGGGGGEGAPR